MANDVNEVYKSRWNGAEIDAAVNNLPYVVSKMRNWEQILIAVGYEQGTAPFNIKESNYINWKETKDGSYYSKYFFDRYWDTCNNFPSVFFFNEYYIQENYNYSLIKRGNKNIGIEFFTNEKDPKKILVLCLNQGVIKDLKTEPEILESYSLLPWQNDKTYPENSIVSYELMNKNYWFKSKIDENIGRAPALDSDYWEKIGEFFDDTEAEFIENKVQEITSSNTDDIHYPSTHAVKQIFDDLNSQKNQISKENEQQNFDIIDLKNIYYDTYVDELKHTFYDLSIAGHPSYVKDENNQLHKVLKNGEVMFLSIDGKVEEWNQYIPPEYIDFELKLPEDQNIQIDLPVSSLVGHKIYVRVDCNEPLVRFLWEGSFIDFVEGEPIVDPSSLVSYENIYTLSEDLISSTGLVINPFTASLVQSGDYNGNMVLVDLTQLYGAGNEPEDIEILLQENPWIGIVTRQSSGEVAPVRTNGVGISPVPSINFGQMVDLYKSDDLADQIITRQQEDGKFKIVKIQNNDIFVLPDEYQELEYIKSTGTQYINTRVNSATDLTINIKWKLDSYIQQYNYLLGYWTSDGVRHTTAFQSSGNNVYLCVDSDFDRSKQHSNIPLGTICTAYFDRNKSILNGVELRTSPTGTLTTSGDIYMFKRNGQPAQTTSIDGQIYYCNMSSDGVLIRNFIPARRISDGVVGMYDTVSNQFFTNQGTGSFIAGPSITNKTHIIKKSTPIETVLVQDLLEEEIAGFIQTNGYVFVSNDNEEFVKPDVTFLYQVTKAIES